jgi:hypothetical protein
MADQPIRRHPRHEIGGVLDSFPPIILQCETKSPDQLFVRNRARRAGVGIRIGQAATISAPKEQDKNASIIEASPQ